MADWNPDDVGPAPPESDAEVKPSLAEIQRRAAAKNDPGVDPLAVVGPAPPEPGQRPVTGPAAPPGPGILSRSWSTILGLGDDALKDLTPTAPHWPGTTAPILSNPYDAYTDHLAPTPSVFADNAPMAEPHFTQGIVRGARDVLDTGAHALASGASLLVPELGIDVDAIRKNDKDVRDAWEEKYGNAPMAGAGRVVGQIAATAGPVGAISRGVTAGASLLAPTAIGDAARFLTGSSGLTVAPGAIAPSAATQLLARTGQIAAQGAGIGGLQAGLTSSGYDEPLDDQIVRGVLTGAVAAPVISGLTRGFDAARGYVGGIRGDVADLADVARSYGVTPPISSMTTNPQLKQFSSAMQSWPGTGADAAALVKQRQFQSGLTKEFDSTADTLGPATMKETADRLSKGYQDLYANAPPIAGGPTLRSDVANVGTDAAQYLVGDQAGAMAHVGNAIRKVNDAFSLGGTLDPRAYKSLMGANDGTLARIEDAAPSAAQPYLQRIRDAVQARFAASAGPDAAARLNDLDRQWRAMKTAQPLAAVSTMGDIAPGGLMQRVVNTSNQFDSSTSGIAYTGGGPLGDLARVGKQFFGSIPDSGTAARIQGYEFARNPLSYLATLLPGATLGRGIQMWNNSPRVAGRAIDVARGAPVPDATRLVPSGLLGPIDYQRDRP